MVFNVQKNSFLHYYDNGTGILDWLETQFIAAGWTIDKTAIAELKEYGERSAYPTCSWTPSGFFPWEQRGLILVNTIEGLTGYQRVLHTLYAPNSSFYPYSGMSVPIYRLRPESFVGGKSHPVSGWLDYDYYAGYGLGSSAGNFSVTSLGTRPTFSEAQILASGPWVNAAEGGRWTPVRLMPYSSGAYNVIGTYKSELYAHVTNSNGDVIYVSFGYNFRTGKIYLYNNLGFDTNLTVDRQPGTIQSILSEFFSYCWLTVAPGFWKMNPAEYVFIGDNNGFFLSTTTNYLSTDKVTNYLCVGSLNKLFNYPGGIVRHSTNYERGAYYVLYNGEWYGPDIAISVTNKQGYMNLLTPISYSTAAYNAFSGELYLTSKLWGINETGTLNAETKPIGTEMNCFMHYGGTPTTNTKIRVAGNDYASIALDASNRLALKL